MKPAIVSFAAWCVVSSAAPVALAAPATPAPPPRVVQPLNDAGTFEGRGVDGRVTSQPVTLPHTWNGDDALKGLDYVRGKGTYTRTIAPSPDWRGRRVFIRFEGANTVADITVNGKHVGQHRGGYTAFAFEITSFLAFDRANTIAVDVDNSPQADVPPLGGDFNIYGGLHRPAQLIVTGPLCVDPLDFASPGVYLKQKDVNADHASVEAVTLISNGGAPTAASVQVSILDASGAIVAESVTDTQAATGRTPVSTLVTLTKPHLWNGRVDPYLYRARIRVLAGNEIVDELEQPLGLRTFRVDAERGLFLNGTHVKANGVSLHQDWSGKGSALSQADHDRDLALILEIGANAVRLAHYPHGDYVYAQCDRSGLLVWTEIPLVGSIVKGVEHTPEFTANARQQLTELIRQHFNNPSVLFWGISNELSAGKGDTGPDALLKALNALAHAEDPSRLTTQASLMLYGTTESLNQIPDVVAFNEYFGWYTGKPEDLGPWADTQHKADPRRPIGVSEYGAGASTNQHDARLRRPFPMFHPWHPEEYQLVVHEQNWRAIAERPFVWGSFVWNMFDFGSNFRREGSIDAINDKGLVTYDRAVRKDAFYFYKANWNPEPMVHLTSKRYVIRAEGTTPIKVYSNLPSVTLTVNGTSLGAKTPDTYRTAVWTDVRLQKGNNVIEVTGADASGRSLRDTAVCVYNGMPWIPLVPAFFRWLIKPLYVLSFVKLLALYYIGFRMNLQRRGWRIFWRTCFFLGLAWCVAIVGLWAYAAHAGMGLFDYSLI
jgi:beta-galactosidase